MHDYKISFKEQVTGVGIVGKTNYETEHENKIRIIVENAMFINTIEVRGRIELQNEFVLIETVQGQKSISVDVSTFDYIQIYCTNFAPTGDCYVIVSSFN